mmetsp:Transcript_1006/g.4099  ORF Transcript_1006/g.4099 Transcript_1006/m.4099 type:complete len:246 (+) Transcript_1006:1604-2341(+)
MFHCVDVLRKKCSEGAGTTALRSKQCLRRSTLSYQNLLLPPADVHRQPCIAECLPLIVGIHRAPLLLKRCLCLTQHLLCELPMLLLSESHTKMAIDCRDHIGISNVCSQLTISLQAMHSFLEVAHFGTPALASVVNARQSTAQTAECDSTELRPLPCILDSLTASHSCPQQLHAFFVEPKVSLCIPKLDQAIALQISIRAIARDSQGFVEVLCGFLCPSIAPQHAAKATQAQTQSTSVAELTGKL